MTNFSSNIKIHYKERSQLSIGATSVVSSVSGDQPTSSGASEKIASTGQYLRRFFHAKNARNVNG